MAITKDELKNTKFFQNLTLNSSGLKEQRATLIAQQVAGVMNGKIQKLENDLNQLDLEIAAHEDLSPDNKYSTMVASKEFQAEGWIDTYYTLLDTRRLIEEKLDLYGQMKSRQFEEVTEDAE